MKRRSEDSAMTAQFDEASGRWRVVGHDGSVYEDGFATNAAAWRWVDDHSEDDQRDAGHAGSHLKRD
jgi:hypothetical protein